MPFKPTQKTKEPENQDKAYEYAVFLLSLRLRTVGELLKKMELRGYSSQTIAATIEQLKNQRYLNDQLYAEIFLENLKTYRTFGYYGIKKKFMEKKLPANLIEQVLEANFSLAEEIKVAKRFLKKEGFVITRPESSEEVTYRTFDQEGSKQVQKMANRLKSRGFRSEVISRLLF